MTDETPKEPQTFQTPVGGVRIAHKCSACQHEDTILVQHVSTLAILGAPKRVIESAPRLVVPGR